MQCLKNKTVVLTGGVGGIGKTTARLFAEHGAQVVISGRRQSVLDAAVAEIGHDAVGVCGDVTDIEHHRHLANLVRMRFGGADCYVACAGIIDISPSAEVTAEEYDRQFAVNTRGVFFGVQSMAPVLRDGGSIILVGSLAATKVLENHAVYAGTKAAIAAFARNWALELKARRIRVNVLSPGPVDTPVLNKLGISAEARPGFLKSMAQLNPAGRLGEPAEVASAALFLASNCGSFVNGTALHVDGGMSLV